MGCPSQERTLPMTQNQQPNPIHGELSRLLADRRWVVGVCRKLLHSAADVDDLAQETANRALQAEAMGDGAVGRGVDGRGRARRGRAWLAQTARRIASETRRSNRHRRDREVRHGENERSAGSAVDPAEALARAEFRERVARAVLELPAAEREAVVLRFYEGLDYSDMGESTGARPEALRQRVSRGLSRIKERLGSEDRGSGTSWRALALGLVGESPVMNIGVKAGAGKLTAAAAWLLCAGALAVLSAVFWAVRTGTPGPMVGSADAEPPGVESGVELAELPAAAPGNRVEATPEFESDVATGSALEASSVAVRLVDETTGAPAVAQRWHLLRTGDFDRGGQPMPGSFFGGPCYPNPAPLMSGVTGDDGLAVFGLPDDDLVHLVTERSERFARGSFAVEIEDGVARDPEVGLSAGHSLFGKVLDDRGEPYPGAVLVGATYAGEPAVWATSDGLGAYRVERLASFPRSFKRVYQGGEATGELRSRSQLPSELELWPSLEAFQAGRAKTKSVSYGFSGGDQERDLTLWRPRTIRGVVFDERREPVEGARVGLRMEGLMGEGLGVQAGIPGILGFASAYQERSWELSAPTGPDGSFEMTLKHNDLETDGASRRKLIAVATDGRMAIEACAPLPFGEVRDGVRLELGASQAIRLSLTDPSGDFLAPPESVSLARLDLGDGDYATTQQVSLASAGDRAELALWRDRLPRAAGGTSGGALLIAGYEPVLLDLTDAPSELEQTLERRPCVPVTVDVSGTGAPLVEKLTLRILYVPEGHAPPAAAAFEEIDGWWLRGDSRAGVGPGETVELLARPGETGYLQVTLHCVYGAQEFDAPITEIGGSDPEYRVEIAAPDWGFAGAGGQGEHPLRHSRNGVLLVDVVDQVTGEPIVPWSFHATSTGRNFIGSAKYRPRRRFGAFPGQASLRFEARGYEPLELGPIQFDAGETVDLGQVSMIRRDALRVRLYRPDGQPGTYGRSARVPGQELQGLDLDPEIRTEVEVSPGGEFLLDHALAGARRVLLSERKWDPWSACQVLVLEAGDGEGRRATVQPWQQVQFRLSGLSGPALYAADRLLVTDTAGLCPVALTSPEASSTTHAFHRLSMPPGRWVIAPAPGGSVTFDPLEFEVAPQDDPQRPTVIDIEARPAG